jgi:hypothetical protein
MLFGGAGLRITKRLIDEAVGYEVYVNYIHEVCQALSYATLNSYLECNLV